MPAQQNAGHSSILGLPAQVSVRRVVTDVERSVAIDGDTALIGAVGADVDGNAKQGAAHPDHGRGGASVRSCKPEDTMPTATPTLDCRLLDACIIAYDIEDGQDRKSVV